MISVDKAVIARLDHSGHHFEILVDPEKAQAFKDTGKFEDVLAAQEVFKDAKQGEKSSESLLKAVFNTTDVQEVAKAILKKGDLQLTTDQRRQMTEQKRKQVVDFIVRQSVNAQTGKPFTPARVEAAMEEAKVHIDTFKKVDTQIDSIIKALRPILPIKIETLKLAVKIPPQYAAKSYSVLKKYNAEKEQWQNDGSLIAVLSFPAGLQDDVFSELNAVTKGEAQTKVLERK